MARPMTSGRCERMRSPSELSDGVQGELPRTRRKSVCASAVSFVVGRSWTYGFAVLLVEPSTKSPKLM